MELQVFGPTRSLSGRLKIPGDKSISHRALLLAAMARGPSRLRGFLRAGVTEAMLECLRHLGADVEFLGSHDLLVMGRPWHSPSHKINCRNSGATMRMLLGALASQPYTTTLDGTPRLRKRPMGRVATPLRQMGARIDSEKGDDQPPITVCGGALHGIDYALPVASAQVKSAILFAALSSQGPTRLIEPGPSRDHTERLLQSQGMAVSFSNQQVTLIPDAKPIPAFTLTIPGDMSSAAFMLCASILAPGSHLILESIGVNPTRIGLLEAFIEMGAQIRLANNHQEGKEPAADLVADASELCGLCISGPQVVRMIDEFPIFAVAATQASGTSEVREAEELRHKESDRIRALVRELRKMGARIEGRPDGFVIEGPTPLHGAVVDSHGDHRLAMALTIAGLIAKGKTTIQRAEAIAESFPDFGHSLASLGAEIT